MQVNKSPPQSKKITTSKRDNLLCIIAFSGEMPVDTFSRIGLTQSYSKKLRSRLYADNTLKPIQKDKLKGVVLTQKAKETLKKDNPKRYRYTVEWSRTDKMRRNREHISAKTYLSMLNADIEFFPDKKPFIFSHSRHQSYDIDYPMLKTSMLSDKPVFLSSTEIKYELEKLVQQIRNSAMTGLVLTSTESFVVYNADKNQSIFSLATEQKAAIFQTSGTFTEQKNIESAAIVLINSFEDALDLINGNRTTELKPSKLIHSDIYKKLYLVPMTADGDSELYALCHKDIRDEVDYAFEDNFGSHVDNSIYINDGFDENQRPTINSCFLDIRKLLRFKISLLNKNAEGRVVCFDFAEEFVRTLMKPAKIVVSVIPIEQIRRLRDEENN